MDHLDWWTSTTVRLQRGMGHHHGGAHGQWDALALKIEAGEIANDQESGRWWWEWHSAKGLLHMTM